MPKPRHRRTDAREQRWSFWAVTAIAVPFLLAVTTGDTPVRWLVLPTFALLLLSFFAGSLSGMVFLARPAVVRSLGKQLICPSQPVSDDGPLETPDRTAAELAPAPTRRPAREMYAEDIPRFASSKDANKVLQVAVLISAHKGPLEAADGGPLVAPYLDSTGVEEPEAFPEHLGGDGTTPPAVVVELVEPGPYPGSVLATADGRTPPSGYCVKGNTRSMLYHTVRSPYFNRTKASVWFRSVADAEQAGFAAWTRASRQGATR